MSRCENKLTFKVERQITAFAGFIYRRHSIFNFTHIQWFPKNSYGL